MQGKIIVLTAPSGAGKTTIAREIMRRLPFLQFSVSATTRKPRPHERHGVDYYFLSREEFERLIREGAFVEYEEVYPGLYYGTLKREIEEKSRKGPVLLDVDVKGARNIKRMYGQRALTIFIKPPSMEALRERLLRRGTEDPESLEKRLARARMELAMEHEFDVSVVNDDLDRAVEETVRHIQTFLQDP